MKGKRILSAVLSAALLLQLSPLVAFAEDTTPLPDTISTVQSEPAPELLAEPTPEPTVEPATALPPEPEAEPTATPTPNPTAEPTATPAAETPAPDATAEPTPEPTVEPTATPDAAEQVQALIDALPDADAVTADTADEVEEQLTAIDDAKATLTDEQLGGLDFARYDAAANALLALRGEAPTDELETLDTYAEPTKDPTDNYYQIDSVDDLKWLATSAPKNVKAKLTADITLNKDVLNSDGSLNTSASANFDEWKPIGTSSQPFIGTFDGNNKTISGLYINDSNKDNVGLFGYIGKNSTATGTVKDVILADSYVRGNENVGGICGRNNGGTIEQSTNQATVTGYEQVGGICGYNSGNITNCTAGGSVSTTSGDYVGGICGYNTEGTVKSCTSGCTVEGKGISTGGICGYNWGGLLGCRNTGTVSGKRWVGGVCGENRSSGNGIQGCYNEGAVFGTMSVGGVCGTNNENLQGCYNEGAVSGSMSVGGVCGTNNANLQECYNNGKVSGAESAVGGVCGFNNSGTVKGCYNTGEVSGTTQNVGGVCGYNYATVENCYYLAGTSEKAVGGGNDGTNCASKTETEFRNGAVAYLLQAALGAGAEQVWGQRIDTGTGETDKTPVLNSTPDYMVYPAATDSLCKRYSNKSDQTFNEHEYDDETGVCIRCGESKPPEEVDGYYEIYNQGQLRWFAELVNKTASDSETKLNARLMKDIAMDGTEWTPIGTNAKPFTGTFDGNGNTITGLTCTDTSAYYVGLVGYASGATIQNVTVKESAFNGKSYIGAVCGRIVNGTITNCHAVKTTIGELGRNNYPQYCGGIVGEPAVRGDGTCVVTDCTNSGTVSGRFDLGGIAGQVDHATVQRCFNTGIVTGSNSEIGGIAGRVDHATVQRCFNSGAVTGGWPSIGGIAGQADGATVQDCGNTGAVKRTNNSNECGGIVGQGKFGGSIQNCYNAVSNMAYPIFFKYDGAVPSLSNCYYLADNPGTDPTAKTAAQFASGEVAYLLQNGRPDTVWGQTLTGEHQQAFPVPGGEKVYQSAPCKIEYTNTESKTVEHDFDNGYCKNCGQPQIAYTVTIPAEVTLGGKATIKATGVTLPNNKQLNVKVADNSVFNVSLSDGTNVVDTQLYTVTKEDGTEVTCGSTVLTAEKDDTEKSTVLTFNAPSTTYSGTYQGAVTFTVSVDEKTS